MNKSITKKTLEQYNINGELSIKKFEDGMTSTSFSVSTKNKNYVLKMFTHNNKFDDIMLRIDYVNYLYANNFLTNKIIQNNDGQFLTTNKEFTGFLMEYVEGSTIPWEKIAETTAKELALFISKLYKLSLKYYKKNSASFSTNNKYTTKIDRAMKNNIYFINIRKSVIHSDISRENVIVNGKKVKAIIDFDDLQPNYLIWDYSTLLTQLFVTKTYGIDWDALKAFHTEFIKNFKWNKNELAAIIPLMIHRNKVIYKEFADESVQNKKIQSILKSVECKIQLIQSENKNLADIFLQLK